MSLKKLGVGETVTVTATPDTLYEPVHRLLDAIQKDIGYTDSLPWLTTHLGQRHAKLQVLHRELSDFLTFLKKEAK